MTFYIKLVAFSIIFYGLVYALPHASSCCDSDAKSSTLQFQVWCLILFQRRPVEARWRGCLSILDIYVKKICFFHTLLYFSWSCFKQMFWLSPSPIKSTFHQGRRHEAIAFEISKTCQYFNKFMSIFQTNFNISTHLCQYFK